MDDLKTLIFRTDRIGDFIISCPFILAYKEKYLNNKIIGKVTPQYMIDEASDDHQYQSESNVAFQSSIFLCGPFS